MSIQFSPVIAAKQRPLRGFSSLLYVDPDRVHRHVGRRQERWMGQHGPLAAPAGRQPVHRWSGRRGRVPGDGSWRPAPGSAAPPPIPAWESGPAPAATTRAWRLPGWRPRSPSPRSNRSASRGRARSRSGRRWRRSRRPAAFRSRSAVGASWSARSGPGRSPRVRAHPVTHAPYPSAVSPRLSAPASSSSSSTTSTRIADVPARGSRNAERPLRVSSASAEDRMAVRSSAVLQPRIASLQS